VPRTRERTLQQTAQPMQPETSAHTRPQIARQCRTFAAVLPLCGNM
jgi:hypothetical protein